MTTSPDNPRGPSVRLTEDILKGLGVTCIWLDAGQDQTRLALRTITSRRSKGERIWFRNGREAEKVEKAVLNRCFEAARSRGGLLVNLPVDQTLEMVRKTAFSLGITPISDADLAATFDSIRQRIDTALVRMKRDGSLGRLNREYTDLIQADLNRGRKTANRTAYDALCEAYANLPRDRRDRMKADFKERREGGSPMSWAQYMETTLSLPATGEGKSEGTKPGTSPGTKGTTLPSYSEWLAARLGNELSRLH